VLLLLLWGNRNGVHRRRVLLVKIAWSLQMSGALRQRSEEQLYALYHENSKLCPLLARHQAEQFAMSPFELYVTSRGFRQHRSAARVSLPDITLSSESLSNVMLRRRSSRNLSGAINLDELATVLRQSLGATAATFNEESSVGQALRAWPSAGGLYPCDTYVVASKVVGLPEGLYHYNVMTNELERLPLLHSPEEILKEGFFWQDFVLSAAAALLFVAAFERTVAKYGERGYRLVLLDTGHAAQNVLLTAEQLHLNAVAVGGFCDDSLATDLNIDGVSEAVVHSVILGTSDE
jgi:SagB-type dehydrogenase family enzyme